MFRTGNAGVTPRLMQGLAVRVYRARDMARIVVIYAHPYPNRSRAGRGLLSAVASLDTVKVRSLYERYPDFSIDAEAERALLLQAELIVWQHPVYWYGVPPLMGLWFEKVLARGWAYGKGGDALRDKACLWVPTTGGDVDAYREGGMHGHPFEDFIPPIQQTARFCGMHWLKPLILHGSHRVTDERLAAFGQEYRECLRSFTKATNDSASAELGASA
jgi:glutathione-regulated potassium-efflux system ancillary protein KefF